MTASVDSSKLRLRLVAVGTMLSVLSLFIACAETGCASASSSGGGDNGVGHDVINDNGATNDNDNDANVNDNGNSNANANDNGNDNGNGNANANDNANDNGNGNANANDNANDNGNDNVNDNGNANANDNANDNDNANVNVNDNNGNDNTAPVATIVTPAEGSTVYCPCDSPSPCFFKVSGMLSASLAPGEAVFLVVRPRADGAPSYYIQFGEKTVVETLWNAQAQVGSVDYPPEPGDEFEIQAVVVNTDIAEPSPGDGPLPDLTTNSLPGLESTSDTRVVSVECDGDVMHDLESQTCWHLYSPYRNMPGEPVAEDQIRNELQMLYDAGARGLVTYEMMNGIERAPCIAKDIGFWRVLAGVYWWTNGVDNGQTDSTLDQEKQAIADNIACIDGIVIGNEGLIESGDWNQPRYTYEDLKRELVAMKTTYPGKPVTTAEGRDAYEQHPDLVWDPELTDFVFPNLHPWWGGWRDPEEGVADLVATIGSEPFSQRGDRLLVLHEAWWPSETEGQDEQAQYDFFLGLLGTGIPFCWGETIDQPWKAGPEGDVGAHWGLWYRDPGLDTYHAKKVVNLANTAGCE